MQSVVAHLMATVLDFRFHKRGLQSISSESSVGKALQNSLQITQMLLVVQTRDDNIVQNAVRVGYCAEQLVQMAGADAIPNGIRFMP